MSEAFNIFPDAEQLAIEILYASVSDAGGPFESYLPVDVGTELPSEPTYPAIVVSRVGGVPTERHRLDHANIQFDVWADTKPAAHDVAQIARAVLHRAEGKIFSTPSCVLTGVEDAFGLAWQFDTVSNQPRYTFAVYLTLHV